MIADEPLEPGPARGFSPLAMNLLIALLAFAVGAAAMGGIAWVRGGLNLWTVPTHKHCNAAYKLDEEYFSVRLAPLVGNANSETAPAFWART